MGTITICIDDEIERRFREVAKNKLDGKKGYISKAITEAITLWMHDKEQEYLTRQAHSLLSKEHHLGKHKFQSRKDLFN